MSKNSICWATNNLKDGAKISRLSFDETKKYIELIQDIQGNESLVLVNNDGSQQSWEASSDDLFANDWILYEGNDIAPPLNDYHVRGRITIGHYLDNSQHNYGFYTKWNIGRFVLISTDLFDSNTVKVETCCGYKERYDGFLFQIATQGSGQDIKFLSEYRNAPLTVFIGTDKYELGAYTSFSNYKNYFWEKSEAAKALREKYFNADMVGKTFEITLQFHLD